VTRVYSRNVGCVPRRGHPCDDQEGSRSRERRGGDLRRRKRL